MSPLRVSASVLPISLHPPTPTPHRRMVARTGEVASYAAPPAPTSSVSPRALQACTNGRRAAAASSQPRAVVAPSGPPGEHGRGLLLSSAQPAWGTTTSSDERRVLHTVTFPERGGVKRADLEHGGGRLLHDRASADPTPSTPPRFANPASSTVPAFATRRPRSLPRPLLRSGEAQWHGCGPRASMAC